MCVCVRKRASERERERERERATVEPETMGIFGRMIALYVDWYFMCSGDYMTMLPWNDSIVSTVNDQHTVCDTFNLRVIMPIINKKQAAKISDWKTAAMMNHDSVSVHLPYVVDQRCSPRSDQ